MNVNENKKTCRKDGNYLILIRHAHLEASFKS